MKQKYINNPIKLETSNENMVYQQDDLFPSAFSRIVGYRQQKKLCDVVLKVEGQSFNAHKLVLSSTIPYFDAMFTNDMVESSNKEIEMKCINATALEALLNFAYSGKIILDNNNVQSIMIGACYFLLDKVKDACANYICERIHPQNALNIRHFAMAFDCSTLAASAEKYIETCFHEVSQQEEYLNLSLLEITNLLGKNELCVESEEQVFEACLRWVKHDVEKRKDHLPDLLSLVRWSQVSVLYITDSVLNEDLIESFIQCRHLVYKALTLHFAPERRASIQSFCTEPRVCHVKGNMYAIAADASKFEYYDPLNNRWHVAPAILKEHLWPGVAVLKNKFYVLGGRFEDEPSSCVQVYDAVKKEWSIGTPMLSERRSCGATVLDDTIYVCGGWDHSTILKSVEKLDPITNSWLMLAPMNKRRRCESVVACQGYVYAIGGYNESVLDSVERYNPATNTWEEVAPMLTKRKLLGVATLNGKLYACGGYDGSSHLKTVEMYDPYANKWTYVAPMNTPRSGSGVTANMGKLWAVGGNSRRYNGLSTMEVYDPVLDSWTYAANTIAIKGRVIVGVI